MSKTLSKVLIDEYDGQWDSFPNATDTLEDYGNISWRVENPPSKSDLKAKGVFETSVERQAEYDAQEYARNRKAEYDALNQFEMQYDDKLNGTTTWDDAIDAIKAKYPKP